MSDFDLAIDVIIHHEAYQRPNGTWLYYANDPNDPGGPTAWGISTLILNREKISLASLGLTDIKNMTQDQAKELYRRLFWDRYGYDRILNQVVATKLFDAAVNMGPGRACRLAQKAANSCGRALDVDGILGDNTVKGINACDPELWLNAMAQEMSGYYRGLVKTKPRLACFLRTWLRRAAWVG